MNATAFKCTNQDELQAKLLQCKQDNFDPTLAIVFSSVNHELKNISTLFQDLNIDVVGCSTAGEIVDASLSEESIAALLLNLDPSNYQIKFEAYNDGNVYQSALNLGRFAVECFENPGLIIMSGGLTIDAEQLVEGIRDGVGRTVPIYGGLAGDDLNMQKTFAFNHQIVSDQGISALIIDTTKVSVTGRAISGWEPVGGENIITKAKGNVVYQINGENAYEVFIRYFGFTENPSTDKIDQLITLQTNYPFQFIREEGYTVLRSPMVVSKEDGTITLTASVKEGDKFRFSYSPGFEVIEQTIDDFKEFRGRTPEADALILFSCKGRHGAFGPMLKDEIKGIYEQWKKPLIGFLSYGEIGDIGKGECEFHNETCSLVLLKEL